eukprot:m51a1_g7620 hypothetical protein (319) ;mRNA; r:294140-295392
MSVTRSLPKYDYSGPVSEHLICAVCCEPFVDPVTAACGHSFCRECATAFLRRAPSCPVCRSPVDASSLRRDLLASAIADELSVRCPNASGADGCQWVGQRQFLRPHLDKECQHTSCSCPHAEFGCDFKGARTALAQHLSGECAYERVRGLVSVVSRLRADLAAANDEISRLRDVIAQLPGLSAGAGAALGAGAPQQAYGLARSIAGGAGGSGSAGVALSIEVGNTHRKLGPDDHAYTLFVRGEGGASIEAAVERVRFTLHPTYARPVHVIDRPPFELKARAWGTFVAKVEVFLRWGVVRTFEHELQFECPEKFEAHQL